MVAKYITNLAIIAVIKLFKELYKAKNR